MAGKVLTAKDINNQSFYSVFFNNAKSTSTRIKASDLSSEPKTWKELRAHLKKIEFLLVCQNKLKELN